jgi:hypothetical protein
MPSYPGWKNLASNFSGALQLAILKNDNSEISLKVQSACLEKVTQAVLGMRATFHANW